MTSPSTLHSRPISRPGRRPRRAEEGEELGKKPKKVNSEIRKQQNRIASRNYREKRKRKFQYLQQFIKDESNDEQTPETSQQQHEAHLSALSAEYEAGPSSSPYMLPSNGDFASMSSSSTATLGPCPAASTASIDTHILPTTQAFTPFEPPWNSPIYDPPPPANMTWNIPTWVPLNYSPRATPRSETFHFSPSTGHTLFEQATSPYHHYRQFASNSDHCGLGSSYEHYNGSQSLTPGILSVSLPTSSSYFQGHYPGPH